MALVSYGSSGDELSDEEIIKEEKQEAQISQSNVAVKDTVEPEFKMRVPRSAKLPNLVPNIPFKKTKEGKVLLSLPDLETLDSSDDSEGETGNTTLPKQLSRRLDQGSINSEKPNLLTLLPPTRSIIIREGNKPMIPHQLITKIRTEQISSKKSGTIKQLKQNEKPKLNFSEDIEWDLNHSDDSDNEHNQQSSSKQSINENEQSSNFFSFYEPEPQNPQAVVSERAAVCSMILDSLDKTQSQISVNDSSQAINNQKIYDTESLSSDNLRNNSIKSFDAYIPKAVITDTEILKQITETQNSISTNLDDDQANQVCWNEKTFVPGPERKRARLIMPGTRVTNLGLDDLLTSTKTEIVSINQSDLTAGAQLELIKSVTSDDSQYRQPKLIENDPGSLAHRKHQITWLAHQAQENEMELEKRWAEARRNKASSRAKYGF